jgi:hypothetical protein
VATNYTIASVVVVTWIKTLTKELEVGYYTQHDLSVVCDPNAELGVDNPYTVEQMLEWCETNGYDEGSYLHEAITAMGEGCQVDEPSKWYDHEKDMRALSSAFPDVLFCLSGDGEEHDDFWKEYYMNGRMQRCSAEVQVIYPEFDPSLLK